MSTTTPKVVMFNMEIGDAPPEESADGAVDHNQLEEQVKELGQAIAGKYIRIVTDQSSILLFCPNRTEQVNQSSVSWTKTEQNRTCKKLIKT